MGPRRDPSRATAIGRNGRDRRSRGAALIEFALVFPILVLLLFGTVDFGIALLNLNTTRQGTREGARQAVVANFGSSTSCTATPDSISGEARKLICLVKNRIGLDNADTRLKFSFPNANQVGDPLLVCAQYPMRSTTGLLAPALDGRVIRTKVEMRIEKTDLNLVAASETALPGQNWSWCA